MQISAQLVIVWPYRLLFRSRVFSRGNLKQSIVQLSVASAINSVQNNNKQVTELACVTSRKWLTNKPRNEIIRDAFSVRKICFTPHCSRNLCASPAESDPYHDCFIKKESRHGSIFILIKTPRALNEYWLFEFQLRCSDWDVAWASTLLMNIRICHITQR